MAKKIRTAVIGVGHLGQHHARIFKGLEKSELVAVVDADPARVDEISERNHCGGMTDYTRLKGQVDAVSIAVPTGHHYQVAKWCFENGIHALVEKPLSFSVDEARELVELAEKRKVILQVGHVERFNPALRTIRDQLDDVSFIEAHRLSPFPFRSTDVGVIMDVMIHDLDIILDLMQSEVVAIRANATNVISKQHEDIANARLEFANGAVANVTASRISEKVARKMRMFCNSKYVNLDFAAKQAWIYKKSARFQDPNFDVAKLDMSGIDNMLAFVFSDLIQVEQVAIAEDEPLRAELSHFLECVEGGSQPQVAGTEGLRAIQLACDILKTAQDHNSRYQKNE